MITSIFFLMSCMVCSQTKDCPHFLILRLNFNANLPSKELISSMRFETLNENLKLRNCNFPIKNITFKQKYKRRQNEYAKKH